jgi:hypothetical protein
MGDRDIDISQFPREREIVIDAGYLASGRHIIYALLEIDVTEARKKIDEFSATRG